MDTFVFLVVCEIRTEYWIDIKWLKETYYAHFQVHDLYFWILLEYVDMLKWSKSFLSFLKQSSTAALYSLSVWNTPFELLFL